MNLTTIKSAVAASFLIAAASVPLTASAETDVYSGKGATAKMSDSNGAINLYVHVFEQSTKSKSNKEKSAGGYIYGQADGGCWYGSGSTDSIEFKATGALPKRVIASGTVVVTWMDWCYPYEPSFTEEVSFNMDLSALTDQAYSYRGTQHVDYGNTKYIYHYDDSFAPAAASEESFIYSPRFGQVNPEYGDVGKSKSHEVQIIHAD